ncbi:MAG: hypothetical protein LBF42_04245, partial [Puniceicoccales bacterium]|nr:hypothetical protein [Puniceicoccales bacterium]
MSVGGEAHDCKFEIELTKANGGCAMVRSSFCSSPFCKKSREMTCTTIDARDVQGLVNEVKGINEFISNRFGICESGRFFY